MKDFVQLTLPHLLLLELNPHAHKRHSTEATAHSSRLNLSTSSPWTSGAQIEAEGIPFVAIDGWFITQ